MFLYRDDMASLPSGMMHKLDELGEHEYWGNEFAKGEMEYCLVEKENGGYVACVTSGSWDFFKYAKGDYITFFHTQTGARTTGVVLGFINKDTDVSQFGINRKVATWTLK